MAFIYELRTGTDADWLQENPILHDGEVVLVSKDPVDTTKKYNYQKIGNGISTYEELPYIPINFE